MPNPKKCSDHISKAWETHSQRLTGLGPFIDIARAIMHAHEIKLCSMGIFVHSERHATSYPCQNMNETPVKSKMMTRPSSVPNTMHLSLEVTP